MREICLKHAIFLTDDVVYVMSHRELAYQIAEQFRVLGKPLGLRECIIVGGMGNSIAFVILQQLQTVTF